MIINKPVALITGVGRDAGIGAGIARKLAADGWELALARWSPYDQRMHWGSTGNDRLLFAEELAAKGIPVRYIEADLERTDAAEKIFEVCAREIGSVSALILSHCESVDSGIMDTTLESFDRHFAVNVRASWQLIQQFALQVPEIGGRILALTSDHTVGNMPYGASKGAMDRIVLAAARELSSRNITANVINPGPIDNGWMDDVTRVHLTARQPTGRLGTPQDIANLVAFLLSPEGSWINGQLLHADGGFSA